MEAFPDDLAGEPGVEAARARLRDAGVEPYAWSNAPGDRYATHEHRTAFLERIHERIEHTRVAHER